MRVARRSTQLRQTCATVALAGYACAAQAISAEALQQWWRECGVAERPQLLQCAAAQEAQSLAADSKGAKRQRGELTLRNGAADLPRFINRSADDGGWRQHFYLGSVDGLEAQLVLTLEDGRRPVFEWVSNGSQSALHLDALPWPAPGGRLMVVVAGAEGEPGGSITLWQRAGERWSQQFRYEPPGSVIYQFHSWRADGASLRLGWQRGSAGQPCQPRQGSLQLRDGPYGWDFTPAPPSACLR